MHFEPGAPILIYGPTASGKSALAIALARRLNGVVINADSRQVYGLWRVLSARPSTEEEAQAPHRLYGHVAADRLYSVGDWLREAAAVLAECAAAEKTPIIVGGTGLYFKALTQGLSEIPAIPEAIRTDISARVGAEGPAAAFAELQAKDPATAVGIDRANPARLIRALEVLAATGRGMADWAADTTPPLLTPGRYARLALAPERAALYARCDARFDAMMAAGALEEARAALPLPADLPAMKTVGATELMAHLRGETTLAAAAEKAKTATRNYAKRQLTWLRGQFPDWPVVEDAKTCAETIN